MTTSPNWWESATGSSSQELANLKLGSVKAGPSFFIRGYSDRGLGISYPNWRLNLNSTKIGDTGLDDLKELPNLKHLHLDSTEITDVGLEKLRCLPDLEGLKLSSTEISDAGLEDVGALSNLKYLHLSSTEITDRGLKHLGGLQSLESLALLQTQVSEEGVKELQQALPNCEILYRELPLL